MRFDTASLPAGTRPFWNRTPAMDAAGVLKTTLALLTLLPLRLAVIGVLALVLLVSFLVCRPRPAAPRFSPGFIVFLRAWMRLLLGAMGFWWISVHGKREV
jgi:hypothetical protein